MDLEEAALLAELRAISEKSAGSRRFNDLDPIENARMLKASPMSSPRANANSTNSFDATSTRQEGKGRNNNSSSDFGVTAASNHDDDNQHAAENSDIGASSWRKTLTERIKSQPPRQQETLASGTAESPVVVNDVLDAAAIATNNNLNAPHRITTQPAASTFTGERGGDAKDDELLALLKGVSNKSSSSSRFDSSNHGNDNDDYFGATNPTSTKIAPAKAQVQTQQSTPANVPPWKRGNQKQSSLNANALSDNVEIHVGAPPRPLDNGGGGFKSKSTFTGDRGGDANDPELLELLRNASSKTNASRFDDVVDALPASQLNVSSASHASAPPASKQGIAASVPPWKRGKQVSAASSDANVDIVVAAPPMGTTFKSDVPKSTFAGERGGDANDAELLSLLRGVSNKAGNSRFDDNDNFAADDDGAVVSAPVRTRQNTAQAAPVTAAEEPEAPRQNEAALVPPWKRGKPAVNSASATFDSSDVIVAPSAKGGFQSDAPKSTFSGERGGDANDAELLALLRGVSSKSGASRFDDNNDGAAISVSDHVSVVKDEPRPTKQEGPPEQRHAVFPPWKREKPQAASVDVTTVIPRPPQGGFKSDQGSSTFMGERGGDANDPELLALLRGISSKTGASRFESDDSAQGSPSLNVASAERIAEKPALKQSISSKLRQAVSPPWKRDKQHEGTAASQPASAGFKSSDQPNTFSGDRGGEAIDPELLALLRGVSGKAGASRFDDDPLSGQTQSESAMHQGSRNANNVGSTNNSKGAQIAAAEKIAGGVGMKFNVTSTYVGERGGDANDPELLALLRDVSDKAGVDRLNSSDGPVSSFPVLQNAQHLPITFHSQSEITSTTIPPPFAPVVDGRDGINLTVDDLPTALVDKEWKVRSAAFELLSQKLIDIVSGRENVWNVDANQLTEDLDGMLPRLLADSNANALDKALLFVLLYGEHCCGATSPEQARAIVAVLIKSNGFSGRPGTTKLASAAVLKLVEVGSVASMNSVIEVLLTEGLASKKPKVVQAAVSLIFDAATEFGAAVLPLAAITSSAPKILSNSNAKVREIGIKILAEICRALGSKDPIGNIIDEMKPAQVKELDKHLDLKNFADPPRKMLRQHATSAKASPPNALAALHAGAEELAAQRYAARPTINLMADLSKTEYSSRVNMPKWSEKVAALNTVIECAGEKPYKLVSPSSACNYVPLINDSKKLLSHTHVAVVGKAMEVLSMLASGVGEKLFSHLRPLLLPLLLLSKDKKLSKGVSVCLDTLFGNVFRFEHLLDQDDAVPDAVDEQKQKNALVRAAALDFLTRCVRRSVDAGPRGGLTIQTAQRSASLCMEKLDDSNADVRKAASDTFKALQDCNDSDVIELVEEKLAGLATKNSRAFKTLSRTSMPGPATTQSKRLPPKPNESVSAGQTKARLLDDVITKPSAQSESLNQTASVAATTDGTDAPMSLSAALALAGKLSIPLWGAPEDDGGILKGLESAKGILRQDAIKSLTSFVESGKLITSKDVDKDCLALVIIVREHTRGLNETNVNIMRGIIQMFLAVCDVHEKMGCLLNQWSAKAGTGVAIAKISDRKASDGCKSLLSALCTVASPCLVLMSAFEALQSAKSPIAHEEFLKWIVVFCGEFGAMSLGRHVGDLIPFLLQETSSSNPKVKRESFNAIGVLHSHLGGQFRALAMSMAKGPLRDPLESCLNAFPYDEACRSMSWPKYSLATMAGNSGDGSSDLILDIPKVNLMSELPDDIISRLGSKEGKTAWKERKDALEEVESALKRCSGLIETSNSNLKQVIDLTRALEQRLSDTQMNLKPIASSVIARLLSVVDSQTQAKIGKIVFSQLINSAMNDIKKPMRDSCLKALQSGVTPSSLDSGNINVDALEVFVSSLIGEVNEVATRAGGLTDVLMFLFNLIDSLPNLDEIASTRGEPLGERYALMVVECLTSSKAETRSAATMILESSIERGIASFGSFRKASERLKPAQQRTIGPLIAKFTKRTAPNTETGKENDESLIPLPQRQGSLKAAPTKAAGKVISSSPSNRRGEVQTGAAHDKGATRQHPLMSRSGAHGGSTSSKPINWPEYPEEPQGASLLTTLKRAWLPFLPTMSAAKLFPESGVSKQDDALNGIELLKEAVALDRSSGEDVVEMQIDYIMKWTAVVLCSRETTTGMLSLLDFVEDLFMYLIERNYSLKDSDIHALVPFLVEKSGLAKGRFRDKFSDIEKLLQADQFVATKQFGSLVCVAVMESSSQAKARAHSCRLCLHCLDKEGLVSVGKKGVLVVAKSLSDETIPENRSLALDLMEQILTRMNGDFQKLTRICGPSLSTHGMQLLEERWVKRDQHATSLRGHTPKRVTTDETHTELVVSETDLLVCAQTEADALPARKVSRSIPSEASAAFRARLQALREPVDNVGHLYDDCMLNLKTLMSMHPPLSESNTQILRTIDGLKLFHASLSAELTDVQGASVQDLKRLKEIIVKHSCETTEQLIHLMNFSSNCGDPTILDGLSVSLMSIALALLMAMFRDPNICSSISQDQFGLLIRATANVLLDPRLELSDTTEAMAKASNTLAVKSAIGVDRHTSLLAILALQQQISLTSDRAITAEDEAFNSRLSRLLYKLFLRVVKTEVEKSERSFNRDGFDLEAVLCGLEDYLIACSTCIGKRPIAMVDACRDMAKKLALAMIQAHGVSNLCEVLDELDLVEMSELVQSLSGNAAYPFDKQHNTQLAMSRPVVKSCSETSIQKEDADTPAGVSSLVSALASAKTDHDRSVALKALRDYEQVNGNSDLRAHLQQVSSPFRAFIERQLSGDSVGATTDAKAQQESSNSMSERIRSIRTRLAATEAAILPTRATSDSPPASSVKVAATPKSPPLVDQSDPDLDIESTSSFIPDSLGTMNLTIPSKVSPPTPSRPTLVKLTSRLARPSPSKLAQPSPSKLPSYSATATSSSQALRERLAASAQGREPKQSPLKNPSTTLMRAAALRARLAAVKSDRQPTSMDDNF
ncbi:hypothetical protein MPSEU_000944700 [Mayamaea pseudoterrestris]|nr:hypothetical protein MPSEU_000944700 [Mayamaea pseudoterrestris]